MMKLIVCTIMCAVSSLVETSCIYTQRPETCIADVICSEEYVIENEFQDVYNENCATFQYQYYTPNPKSWTLYVTLKDAHSSIVPVDSNLYNPNERLYFMNIVELKLTNNNYIIMPDVTEMASLEILNVANNLLSVAKLYNVYELRALNEIDYSYNSVNKISVDSEQYVYRELVSLNISHNYLVSLDDAIFDFFPKLEILDLSYNFIDVVNFMTFEGLKKLRYLNLSNNRIARLNLALLRFNALEELYVSNNKIDLLDKRDFEKFASLKVLDLKNNLIENVIGNIFRDMQSLNDLDISSNQLESLDKNVFEHLYDLRKINLSNNKLKALPQYIFKNNLNISSLFIQGNKMEGSIMRGVFEGLRLVPELDLSFQELTTLTDYAFFGLNKLTLLNLNNNKLDSLSKNCFKSLEKLYELDLSNNKITSLDFDTSDLISLDIFSLRSNFITHIKVNDFRNLLSLSSIDLSNNSITHIESYSFQSLSSLTNLDIHNNNLNYILEENTFTGLGSLPNLDISRTLITIIKNNSFTDMSELEVLNISQSKIKEIEYNAFFGVSSIKELDLSKNELCVLQINTSHLINLQTLLVSHNLLKQIKSTTLKGMFSLVLIDISYNSINSIADEALEDQTSCQYFDCSFNSNLKFNGTVFQTMQDLHTLITSGTPKDVSFLGINSKRLAKLILSQSQLTNITKLDLKYLTMLTDLDLNKNNLTKIEVGNFIGLKELRVLDLSFNFITFIQPGAFKENTLLNLLNISHNHLSSIGYGVFRGLIYLKTINLSYNEITNLKSERFYEVHSLSHLIADHNKINYIGVEEFTGVSLSIGDNPLPCEILIKFRNNENEYGASLTAIRLDHESENVDGITCNNHINSNQYKYQPEITSAITNTSDKYLLDIRNILWNSSFHKSDKSEQILEGIEKLLQNITLEKSLNLPEITSAITNTSDKYLSDIKNILWNSSFHKSDKSEQILGGIEKLLQNITLEKSLNTTKQITHTETIPRAIIIESVNKTNTLLEEILQSLLNLKEQKDADSFNKHIANSKQANDSSSNTLYNTYINKVKQYSDDTITYVNNKMVELDSKIKAIVSRLDGDVKTRMETKSESTASLQSDSSNKENNAGERSFIFMETCVSLILIILICIVLYKLYHSNMFFRKLSSSSTRDIVDSMESSNL